LEDPSLERAMWSQHENATVAAISQIPATKAGNTVLEGPSLERAMWSQHENAA